jgi:pantoate kinase
MRESVAFSPGHVKTKVLVGKSSRNSFQIRINGQPTDSAKVSEHVIGTFFSNTEKNHRITVDHSVQIPVGSGFGSSGAGALSLALALNNVFDTIFSSIEAAQVAHIAEIQCKTGLGTVIAETVGGLEMRIKPGGPGVGEVRNIPVNDDYVVAYMSLGPISTSGVLDDEKLRRKINEFGDRMLHQLNKRPEPQAFMNLSREFSEHVGLISPRIRKVLLETDSKGLTCSMAMLGESLFSLVKREDVEELLKICQKHASAEHNVLVTERDFEGARLLD